MFHKALRSFEIYKIVKTLQSFEKVLKALMFWKAFYVFFRIQSQIFWNLFKNHIKSRSNSEKVEKA